MAALAGFARTYGVGLVGVSGHLVEVEVHLAQGLPAFVITGLPDTAVAEARDRVRAAVLNSGFSWPNQRLTVGLGPAWLPKRGSNLDLAVAVAILAATGVIPADSLTGIAFIGELGLDGRVRPARGVFPAVLAAAQHGVEQVVVPAANLTEANLVRATSLVGVHNLRGAIASLRGEPTGEESVESADNRSSPSPGREPASGRATSGDHQGDLTDVRGQELGRRALELAAAGAHHLALFGPPGAGKTMLAERLPGLLPQLDDEAAWEVTAIHSVVGALDTTSTLVHQAPYQAPHHTTTLPALVGGGTGLARPGVISLAHRGVLFLDEAPEFSPRVLEALRQPLETGEIILARSQGITRYPARVQLVIAANPCPCAAPAGDGSCICSPLTRRRYFGRLSGPLLDRIDIQVTLPPVTAAALLADDGSEPSAVVAERVRHARAAAADRWRSSGWQTNAEASGTALREGWALSRSVIAPATCQVDRGVLSARGFDRVLRLAWTLADLAGRISPDAGDVSEALFFRLGDL